MILHRYVSWRFLRIIGAVAGVFATIVVLIDLIEQIGRFGGSGTSLRSLLHLAALRAPQAIYSIVPLIVLLAGLALFAGLARSSEMAVIRAAGRSASRTLVGPGIVLLALGALIVTAGNPIVAATSVRAGAFASNLSNDGASGAATARGTLWLREGSAAGQTVFHAQSASPDGTRLHDVTVLGYDEAGRLTQRYQARMAELRPGQWVLHAAKQWQLRDPAPEASAVEHSRLTLPSTLTKDRIRESFGAPSAIAIWDLPEFIRTMESAGFSAKRHRVWFQAELSSPLFLLAMLVLAAGFTLGHPRGGGAGIRILGAVISGFALYFLRNFAMVLGENGQIAPWLAAWAPPVAALMLASGLLLTREDG